jgi:hypothetical protein
MEEADTAHIRERFRKYNDRELQAAIVVLSDLRNRAARLGWAATADREQQLLLIACECCDERAALARSVDEATNPFRLLGDDEEE